LAKGKDSLIDLDALLVASTGHPTYNKAAKAAEHEVVSIDRIQSSNNKCLVESAHSRYEGRQEVGDPTLEARRKYADQGEVVVPKVFFLGRQKISVGTGIPVSRKFRKYRLNTGRDLSNQLTILFKIYLKN
jgi:hypothetical protein